MRNCPLSDHDLLEQSLQRELDWPNAQGLRCERSLTLFLCRLCSCSLRNMYVRCLDMGSINLQRTSGVSLVFGL